MSIKIGCQQHKKRWQRASSESTFVSSRVHNLVSWLLILILSTAPFQSSIAMHFDVNTSAQDSQVLVIQPQETAFASDRQGCIVNLCQSLSACAAHLNCNLFTSSSPQQLFAQAQFFYHALIGDVSVSTRFPDLFKRPPKS
jgi:hypothetical protein